MNVVVVAAMFILWESMCCAYMSCPVLICLSGVYESHGVCLQTSVVLSVVIEYYTTK